MKTKTTFLFLLSVLFLPAHLGAASPPLNITIKAYDTMKYSVTKVEAKPGQKVVVELTNEGNLPKAAMGHNWILLKAGSDPLAYANAAMKAKVENYQPRSLAREVLAVIPLLGPKESGRTSFTAPPTPGSYPFLCSFPAHYQTGMKGVLIVK